MQEETRNKIGFAIRANKECIKRRSSKDAWARDPNLRNTLKMEYISGIKCFLDLLRAHHAELLPFVKKMKSHVDDITESSHVCAVYLLLCHAFDSWNSVFLLAEKGQHLAVGNILRMIKEAISIVELFAVESYCKENKYLNKWFAGEIIDQAVCRKKSAEFFGKHCPYPEFDGKKLNAHIYQVESQVSHNSYASVLESVSPFTEDFDFDGYSGFYRTVAWLRYAKGSLSSTNITLKIVYQFLIQDKNNLAELDKILLKFDPEINDGINEDTLKDFLN